MQVEVGISETTRTDVKSHMKPYVKKLFVSNEVIKQEWRIFFGSSAQFFQSRF